ncbi:MAG: 6-bladed beta-propeller [Gemmatimonadota bacterium]
MNRGTIASLMAPLLLISATAVPAQLATRDQSQVPVIDNPRPAWNAAQRWRLSAKPVLEIGTDVGDPNYEFGFAHGPVRLRDGRIVVADMQANHMRFYDAKGKYLMTVGRTGEGPGEFEQLYRLRKIAGDSLMALNPTSLTSIFSPEGKYIRRFDLDLVRNRQNMWWLGRLSNGTLLAFSLQREGTVEAPPPPDLKPNQEYARFRIPPKPPNYRDTLMHFLFDMQGRMIDSVAKLPGQFLGEQSTVMMPNAAYAVHDNLFFHSPGDAVEIRVFRSLVGSTSAPTQRREGGAARLERIMKRPSIRSLAITDSMKKEYEVSIRARYARFPGTPAEKEANIQRAIGRTRYPEAIPAHGNRMYADDLGNIWLQQYQINAKSQSQWSVFDPNGRWLGQVETPVGFVVNEIGADYILGVGEDELGVQYVRMYRLEKPR